MRHGATCRSWSSIRFASARWNVSRRRKDPAEMATLSSTCIASEYCQVAVGGDVAVAARGADRDHGREEMVTQFANNQEPTSFLVHPALSKQTVWPFKDEIHQPCEEPPKSRA